MKEHTAAELEGHRIRITTPREIPVPTGRAVSITDLETGEEVQNVHSIDLHIVPIEVITARLSLLHISLERAPEGGFQVDVREEQLIVTNPVLDLSAIVQE